MDNSAARNPRFWKQMATFCSMVNNKLKEEDFDEPDTTSKTGTDADGHHHPVTDTWGPGYPPAPRMAHHEHRGTAAAQPDLWRGFENPRPVAPSFEFNTY